jgi:hypothetical protein
MFAFVREITGVLLPLVSDHSRAAVEALTAVPTFVQLNASMLIRYVVTKLDVLKELGATLGTLESGNTTQKTKSSDSSR